MELFGDPLIRTLAAPFAVALLFGVIIRLAGRGGSGRRIAAAGAGIAFAWSAAFALGAPPLPPEMGFDSVVTLAVAALVLGLGLDFYFNPERDRGDWAAFLELGLIILYGIGAPAWLRGGIDAWAAVILLAWGFTAFRMRALAHDGVTPSVMLMMTAAGLGVIAWAAKLPVDQELGFGLAAAAAGFLVLSLADRSLAFGATALLGFAGGILTIGVRIAEEAAALIPAVLILGFIFFTDSLIRRPALAKYAGNRLARSGLMIAAALAPIALAAAAALIGARFAGP
ncbi:MAG: hypothetical protein QGH73_09110 [Rhodospirillales bacterium]|jgi:hypothetical protein|nr:hypothetical protein [Rhodospirillaceae bacterium]MDP6427883.1 hypothetical protein [Rhodospirillales bacterium]MDP6644422.1 hypothetical protein [Rhodospirillales bacterium]MDP6841825.1 hypothetical protein [Rhodospirillales bacterium]